MTRGAGSAISGAPLDYEFEEFVIEVCAELERGIAKSHRVQVLIAAPLMARVRDRYKGAVVYIHAAGKDEAAADAARRELACAEAGQLMAAGRSRRHAAERVGVPETTLRRWLAGKPERRPTRSGARTAPRASDWRGPLLDSGGALEEDHEPPT